MATYYAGNGEVVVLIAVCKGMTVVSEVEVGIYYGTVSDIVSPKHLGAIGSCRNISASGIFTDEAYYAAYREAVVGVVASLSKEGMCVAVVLELRIGDKDVLGV